MHTEIEAKFLDINHNHMRTKLEAIGAKCTQSLRVMKRKNYDYADMRLEIEKTGWVRVRDEGDKITMSYKQLDDRSILGTKEVNLVVDSFDNACAFLESIGLVEQSYQVTKRESWRFGDVEIELDEWPWIKPFLEIEGPGEDAVRHVADRLDLDWSDAVHGSVEVAYQAEYDVTEEEVCHWGKIVFEVVPDWLEAKRK